MRKESSLICANFLPTALVALGVPTRVPVGTAHLTTVYAAARSDRETKALPSYSDCFSLSHPHFCPSPPQPPCSSLRGNGTKLFLQEKTTSSPGSWVFILKSAVNLAEPHKDNAKTVWAREWVERSRGAWGWLGRSSTGAEAQDPQESLEVLRNHAFYVNAYCSRPCLSPGEAICGKKSGKSLFWVPPLELHNPSKLAFLFTSAVHYFTVGFPGSCSSSWLFSFLSFTKTDGFVVIYVREQLEYENPLVSLCFYLLICLRSSSNTWLSCLLSCMNPSTLL